MIGKKVFWVFLVIALIGLSAFYISQSTGQTGNTSKTQLKGYIYDLATLDILEETEASFYMLDKEIEGELKIHNALYTFDVERFDKAKIENGTIERFKGEIENDTNQMTIRIVKATSTNGIALTGIIYLTSNFEKKLGFALSPNASRLRMSIEENKARISQPAQTPAPIQPSTISTLSQPEFHTVHTEEIAYTTNNYVVVFVAGSYENIFSDAFSGSLSKWTTVSGTWAIESGEASQSSDVSPPDYKKMVAGDSVWKNYYFEAHVNIKTSSGWFKGIVFRYQDENNYYFFHLDWASQAWFLRKMVAGSRIDIASGSIAVNPNQWYNLTITVNKNKIRGYIDSTSKADVTDNSLSWGKIGLLADKHTHFDDVKVKSGDIVREKQTKSIYTAIYGDENHNWYDDYCDYVDVDVKSFSADSKEMKLEFNDPYPPKEYSPWSIGIDFGLDYCHIGASLGISYTPLETDFKWDDSYGYQRAHWPILSRDSMFVHDMLWKQAEKIGYKGICVMFKAIPGLETAGTQVSFTVKATMYCHYFDQYGQMYEWYTPTTTSTVYLDIER